MMGDFMPAGPSMLSQNPYLGSDILNSDIYDNRQISQFNQPHSRQQIPPQHSLMNPNYEKPRSFRGAGLSDFLSWNSEEDDDYSLNSDLEQNYKIVRFLNLKIKYRQDQKPYRTHIPKAEVLELFKDNL